LTTSALQISSVKPGEAVIQVIKAATYSSNDEELIIKEARFRSKGKIEFCVEYLDNFSLSNRGKFSFIDRVQEKSGSMTQVSISLAQVAQYLICRHFIRILIIPEYPWREISTAKNACVFGGTRRIIHLRLDSDHFWVNSVESIGTFGRTRTNGSD